MRLPWGGRQAWARRGILLTIGVSAIVLSEIPAVAQFAGGANLGPIIFRSFGSAGLILALMVDYIASWQHAVSVKSSLVQRQRCSSAVIRAIQSEADVCCELIRQCNGDIERCIADRVDSFLSMGLLMTGEHLFDRLMPTTLFLPVEGRKRMLRITCAYPGPGSKRFDRNFKIELRMEGGRPYPVDGLGLAGHVFGTGCTYYMDMQSRDQYELVMPSGIHNPLERARGSGGIWKPSTLEPDYRFLAAVPLFEITSTSEDHQVDLIGRRFGVMCFEISSPAGFSDHDFLLAWLAARAFTQVLATAQRRLEDISKP